MDLLSPYAKAVVAAVTGIAISVLVVVQSVSEDGMSSQDWIVVAIALLTSVGVYLVPNKPKDTP